MSQLQAAAAAGDVVDGRLFLIFTTHVFFIPLFWM